MKADTFVKLLRKVVREEVQQVVREELGLLLETPVMAKTKKSLTTNSMVESIKTIKSAQPSKPMSFTNNNVLNDILNETANGGEWRSIADATSQMAPNFGPMNGAYGDINETTVVSSVDQMLANTRPSGDINSVKIDTVPDFTGLMSKMKEQGQI
jgi:hypothetical protein